MANMITILRMIIAFIAISLLFYQTPASYITAFILTAIAIWFDGLDGFVARLLGESSKFGAVLDILRKSYGLEYEVNANRVILTCTKSN